MPKRRENEADNQTPTNKKRALKHERASHKPNFDLITASKDIWGKLRKKTNSKEENRELADELFALIKGKMLEIGQRHDASRVVQAMVQFGTDEQRAVVLDELKGAIADMSKSQYGHFIVLKLIKYCSNTPSNKKKILKAFAGQVTKLATHSVGARVIEVAFGGEFTNKETEALRREFYGKQYALFSPTDSSSSSTSSSPPPSILSTLLSAHPDAASSILTHVRNVIDKIIEKKLFPFEYAHELIASYTLHAPSADVANLGSSVVDNSIELLSTRAGTTAIAQFAAYAGAKDRKRILKSLRGYASSLLTHRDAYVALMRVILVTDDTVTVQKMILNELLRPEKAGEVAEGGEEAKHPLHTIAMNPNASKLLLLLLNKQEDLPTQYLDPWEEELLKPALALDDKGEMVSTSRKNPQTRKAELLQYMKSDVISLVTQHAGELLDCASGAKILAETTGNFGECDKAIVDAIEGKGINIFEDAKGHSNVKKIILKAKDRGGDFGVVFWEKFSGASQEILNSSRGAFVLAALCDSCPEVLKKIKVDKDVKKIIKAKIKKGGVVKGYEALLEKL
ncbi:hypothetical protein TrCOL_g2916 [Triparma columacea]|uniref:PUM-HD domain-containing protein n=1 Tax=Triparma columacea TaxID=722753 RepID=A0A9W7GE85_9STRA|nr:hypothetical protein TrCOL_g2916 [Triparma columacea]